MLYIVDKIGVWYKVFDTDDDTVELARGSDIKYLEEREIIIKDVHPAKILIKDGRAFCIRYEAKTKNIEFMIIDNEDGEILNAVMKYLPSHIYVNDLNSILMRIDNGDVTITVYDSGGNDKVKLNITVDMETGSFLSIDEDWQKS